MGNLHACKTQQQLVKRTGAPFTQTCQMAAYGVLVNVLGKLQQEGNQGIKVEIFNPLQTVNTAQRSQQDTWEYLGCTETACIVPGGWEKMFHPAINAAMVDKIRGYA